MIDKLKEICGHNDVGDNYCGNRYCKSIKCNDKNCPFVKFYTKKIKNELIRKFLKKKGHK